MNSIDDKGIRTIGKIITYDDLLHLPRKIGGRIAVIPWFVAPVSTSSGTRSEPMVRLCVSNHLYLSDFGGGFRAHMTPYDGLVKELEEEIPAWKDELLTGLSQPNALILAMEQSTIKPQKAQPIPLQILAFVPVSVTRLNQIGFQPSSEIRAIMDRTLRQFNEIADRRHTMGSSGIRMYHLFRKKPQVRARMDAHFRSNMAVDDVEYKSSDLVDEKVDVLLANGVTTDPFSDLLRENSALSHDLNKAWPIREKYAKERMARKGDMKSKKSNKSQNQSQTKSQNQNQKVNNNGFQVISHLRKNKTRRNKPNKNRK